MSTGGWPPPGRPGPPQHWGPPPGRPVAAQPWSPQRPPSPPAAFYRSAYGPPHAQWGAPMGFRPQPPPRPSRGLGWLLSLLVFVGAGVFFLSSVMGMMSESLLPDGPAAPTTPAARPSADATPSPEPTPPPGQTDPSTSPQEPATGLPPREWPDLPPPNSSDPDWVTLQQSVLYAAPIPTLQGCPEPRRVSTLGELEEEATAQMGCIQAAWKPVLADLGLRTHDIPVYFYPGREVETPCGSVSAPALYCSAQGGSIYFGEDTLDGAAWHDFGVKDMAGHEYGHHLQAEAGMFLAEYNVGGGNENARRLELQATCMGYAMIANDTSFVMDEGVYSTFEPYLRAVIEDGIHGSKDSVAYWGLRGLYSSDVGNCNTWTSASEDVD